MFQLLFFFSNTGLFLTQKRFVDLVKMKVDVDKTCRELKERLSEMEAGQHLPKAVKRVVIEEYMKSLYFTSIRQELVRRAATTIRRELRARHPLLNLSFMTLRYDLTPSLYPCRLREDPYLSSLH